MLTVSVELPPEIALKLQAGAGVTTGETAQESVTVVTSKPPLPVRVTVDVADPPGAIDDGDRGLAVIVKPGTWKLAVTA